MWIIVWKGPFTGRWIVAEDGNGDTCVCKSHADAITYAIWCGFSEYKVVDIS